MSKIPNKIKNNIENFLDEISYICNLNRVVLYGSYASGNASQSSDIDIAIFSKDANDKNRLDLMTKILMKVPKYKLDLQPLVFSYKDFISNKNDFINNEIKHKGVVLR